MTAPLGPLTLMMPRRSAERDREARAVTTNAGADIHRLGAELDELAALIESFRDAR